MSQKKKKKSETEGRQRVKFERKLQMEFPFFPRVLPKERLEAHCSLKLIEYIQYDTVVE